MGAFDTPNSLLALIIHLIKLLLIKREYRKQVLIIKASERGLTRNLGRDCLQGHVTIE